MSSLNLFSSTHLCTHFNECSGCTEDLGVAPPQQWQDVICFFENVLTPALYQGSPIHWRHRAKVAVRGTKSQPLIGLFKSNSHEVSAIPHCLVHHPKINEAFYCVEKWLQKHAIEPYREVQGTGEIRYLQANLERSSGKVQLTLIVNFFKHSKLQLEKWKSLIEELALSHLDLWHSIWMNFNPNKTNTILGEEWLHCWGKELLWENFNSVQVCYGPASFCQANLPLFEKLLSHLSNWVNANAKVTELYAGVGVIGLSLASKCQKIICTEINPFAENYFNHSLARLNEKIRSRIDFKTCSAQQSLACLQHADTLIVDPPRKGLTREFIFQLKEFPLKNLFYVSCGWLSFKKDCALLQQEGWQLKASNGYVFFPGTDHIELLVHFQKD